MGEDCIGSQGAQQSIVLEKKKDFKGNFKKFTIKSNV
jgi:hypothetical protein